MLREHALTGVFSFFDSGNAMAEKNVFDVAIIGLGPSGATFARLLDPRLKVLALDKKDNTENSFQKPCGGLLAHDAQ